MDTFNPLIAGCDWACLIIDAYNIDSATINFSKYMALVREFIPERTVTIRPLNYKCELD